MDAGISVQVYKAYFARAGKYVAVKKIDCYERVRHTMLTSYHTDVLALCRDIATACAAKAQ